MDLKTVVADIFDYKDRVIPHTLLKVGWVRQVLYETDENFIELETSSKLVSKNQIFQLFRM